MRHLGSTERIIEPEADPDDLKARLEKAEAVLHALDSGEADAVLSRDGLSYVRPREAYEHERQGMSALRESAARFRAMADNAPVLIWMAGPDKLGHWFNQRWLDFTGRTMAQEIGNGWTEGVHPDDFQRRFSIYCEAFDRREEFEVEYRLRDAQGAFRWILERAAPDHGPEGDFLGYIGSCVDITERRRVEQALREKEVQLRIFIQHAPTALAMLDRDIRYIAASRRWMEDFGLGDRDIRGLSHYEVFPEIPESWKEIHRRVLAGETIRNDEDRFERADGSVQWLRWEVLPWNTAAGSVGGMVIFSEDITVGKLAMERLRLSERDLQRAQQVGAIGSWRLDVRRNELTWSEENYRIFAVPAGTAMTYESFLDCVHPDDRAYVDTAWQAALRGEPYDIEHRLRADGELKWVRQRAELEVDADGTLLGGFGTTQDITERKDAEERIRASEALYRGIGETIDYGVWVCEPSGQNRYASASFLKMVGLTQQQCSDFGWGNVLHPDDAEATIAAWQECVRTGGTWDREHRFLGVDGKWHHVLARGARIKDEKGNTTCWAGINLDITALKIAQEELQQAKERAEAASNAKAAFLANMSHEIRTPLGVIVGLAHLLHRDIVDPMQRRKLEQLCATSAHLMAIINDILDLSRIEAERLELAQDDFSLGSVVTRVTRMLGGRAREKGLSLRTDVAPPLRGLWLHGDALRLAQVLINLCGNGIKFTEKGTVSLSIACVTENSASVTLHFTMADTGCGIASVDQARLFEPFAQGNASATRQHGGTGLGLSISKQLVALMGGTIQVDSQVGAGSIFSFELVLPRATGNLRSDTAAPATPVPTSLHGRHILFAEDHSPSAEIVLEMLGSLGCETDLASNGAEAVESARAGAYDLILMDMQMPGMDGLTATRAIRALPGYGATPIIALTANAFAEDRQRCLDAGMNAYLGKPVTPSTLAAALGKYLSDRPVSSDVAEACDSELSRALLQIQGLEVGPAWLRSPETIVAYHTQLERFIKAHEHQMTRLREHLASEEHDAARVLAHNLKGIAGLVGAQRVAAQASKIEEGLRTGAKKSAINYRMRKCAAELARLAQALRELPAPAAESASPSQEPPRHAG